MYPNGIGHALQGHAPDKIANRPELYLQYVNDLVGTLGGNSYTDLFTFDYVAGSGGSTDQNSAVFETEVRLREDVSTFSVLGDQTGVIGNYLSARDKIMVTILPTKFSLERLKKVNLTKMEM